MVEVMFIGEDIAEVRLEDWIGRLKEEAQKAPFRRARLCLHHDHTDPVHEMFIVFCRDSIVPIHKHLNKSESFHVIEGELDIVIFDDDGNLIRRVEMGPPGSGKAFLYRMSVDAWHSVVPRSEFVAIHETTTGPFEKDDCAYAPWVEYDDDALREFLTQCGAYR